MPRKRRSGSIFNRPLRKRTRRTNHPNSEATEAQTSNAEHATSHPNSEATEAQSSCTENPPSDDAIVQADHQVQTYSTGKLDHTCSHCEALHFKGETYNCCQKGKVKLPQLAQYPEKLKELLARTSTHSRNFHQYIRQYNSAMAFASFGAKVVTPPNHGPYSFRIHGQIYHRSGTLHPPHNSAPAYSQLYIIDSSQALAERMSHTANQQCLPEVMTCLATEIEKCSPYAAAYKRMKTVEEEHHQHSVQQGTEPPVVTMHILRGSDQQRYNDPTVDEVAIIFSTQDGAPPLKRDIVVHPKNQAPQQISSLSPNADPMVYPIFFPHGELGWHHEVQNTRGPAARRQTVSCLEHYAYRLSVREEFSPLFYGSKLFQQYIVDAYVRVEGHRLNYIKANQSNLRVELYQGLMDHINTQSNLHNLNPGRIVVLPSSFTGSPRAMQQNYQDAMSIVARYGKPDLFVTFTCNPRCKDITDALLPGQQPQDRPDIVARVYHQHLKELLKDITQNNCLGKPTAHVHVIEFQKRGLPHCHMLIILSGDDKIRTADDIDALISAEIPDKTTQPHLFEIVRSTMVHGPCGVHNRNAPCMQEGGCTKDYPKKFQNQTTLANNGYPSYMRRDNGRTMTVGKHEVNNQWIVPYSPYLTQKYNAHINVEACTSIKSVKYLFKYVYKGHDCANIQVTEHHTQLDHDEVTTFVDARYVSAPEAFWRLAKYKLHNQSHTIIRLAVHLPNQQPVYFTTGRHEVAAENATDKDTMLTAFFKLNRKEPTNICYNEVPKKYVFDPRARQWKLRQRRATNTIGRMYSASPKDIERFCLRLLLLHTPSPLSYEHLRTVNNVLTSSFKEACILRRLIHDDKEWDQALTEATVFQMPRQLRSLFATICMYCNPLCPEDLWSKHKEAMVEDYANQNYDADTALRLGLRDISEILQQHGMTLSELGLPPYGILPTGPPLQYDAVTEAEVSQRNMAILNNDQRRIVDRVIEDIQEMSRTQSMSGHAYFLDGPGGSGKTMVYNTLIAFCRSQQINVASSAWTGIAATLLNGGRTVHNLFKLPVPVLDNSSCNVKPTSQHAQFLRNVSLFIIDEASMVPSNAIQAIDRMLQDITGQNILFGGKIFLMGGDFRQVLPVVPRQSRTVIIENCLKSSPLWQHFEVYKLTKNMRADAEQTQFPAWLLALGNGTPQLEEPSASQNSIAIPSQCNVVQSGIVNNIFDNLHDNAITAQSVILTPLNETTLKVNDDVLQKLPGETTSYFSADKAIADDEEETNNYPVEFLNSITPSGMPPHKLNLKQNAIVMLLRNLDIKKGLCNGTRLRLCHLHTHVLDAQILTGSHVGHRVLIPRLKLAPSDINLPFTLQRVQFPLRLAYSMTINKAQGQTFNKIGIFLPDAVFAHGQLYVAFSRARNFESITVQIAPTEKQRIINGRTYAENVVYQEVL